MHVHGKTTRLNPKLSYKEQTKQQTWWQRLINTKQDKAKAYYINKIKKLKQKRVQNRVSGHEYVCAYIGPVYTT